VPGRSCGGSVDTPYGWLGIRWIELRKENLMAEKKEKKEDKKSSKKVTKKKKAAKSKK
jgi:hypothetical protein